MRAPVPVSSAPGLRFPGAIRRRARPALLCFAWACAPAGLFAQELYIGPLGRMASSDFDNSSFAWEYGYRQYITPNFALSTSWLNEGHMVGHHRDGSAWQVWGNLPLDNGRFALSVGVGAYYYFDTEPTPTFSIDAHGTAPIYSATATWYATDRFFVRLAVNSVNPTTDVKIESFDVGLGVWMGAVPRFQQKATDMNGPVVETGDEFTLYGGFSVENALTGEHRYAYAAEYRRGFYSYCDVTLSYFDETNLQITRRRGLASQLWVRNTFFKGRVTAGVGAGVYTAVGPRNTFKAGQYFTPIAAPFFSQTVSYFFNDHVDFRITWNRVTGYDSPDADVILFGLGYSIR
jgi:hypothetical protein